MDVNMDTIASQGIALNKAQAGADILRKTLQKQKRQEAEIKAWIARKPAG